MVLLKKAEPLKLFSKSFLLALLALTGIATPDIQANKPIRLEPAAPSIAQKINTALTQWWNKTLGRDSTNVQRPLILLPNDISPESYKIGLDLDNTVVAKKPYKRLVLKNVHVILYCLLRHTPTFLNLATSKASSEEWQTTFKTFNDISTSYEHRFADMIQEISQGKYLLPGMEDLIRRWHAKGFELHILTNMGEKDYQHLSSTNDVFNLCSDVTYVKYNEKNKEKIKKPNPDYFINYFEKVRKENSNPENKGLIFIDDALENCTVAHDQAKAYKGHFWPEPSMSVYYVKVPGNNMNAAFIRQAFRQTGYDLE